MMNRDRKGSVVGVPDVKIAIILFLIFLVICLVLDNSKINGNSKTVEQEVAPVAMSMRAGNPTNYYTRVVCAQVTDVNSITGIVTFTDEDGEMWVVEAEGSDLGTYNYRDNYCIFFDRMGTDYLYDDEVVKVWKEVG